jgi:hypothetical protein
MTSQFRHIFNNTPAPPAHPDHPQSRNAPTNRPPGLSSENDATPAMSSTASSFGYGSLTSAYSTPTHSVVQPAPRHPPGLPIPARSSGTGASTRISSSAQPQDNHVAPKIRGGYKGYTFGHLAIPYMIDEMNRKNGIHKGANGSSQ